MPLRSPLRALPVCLALLLVAPSARAQIYPYQEELWKDARMVLEIYGESRDTLSLGGTAVIGWSDPVPAGPYEMIETQILGMNLEGQESLVFVRINQMGPPSLGAAQGAPPEFFPAESFFDVFFEIEVPDVLPGALLRNSTPVHISSTVDQFPPYFHDYASAPGAPIVLEDQFGTPLGEIEMWSEAAVPWSPPRAWIDVPTCYGTDEAEQDEFGFVPVGGFVTGGVVEPVGATFSWRPGASADPWMTFAVDGDGSEAAASLFWDSGEGDGWAGYFDPALAGPDGAYIDFRVDFDVPGLGTLSDSATAFVDLIPLVPQLDSPPESLVAKPLGEIIKLIARLLEQRSRVDSLRLWVFPFATEKHRELTPIDQYGLSGATKPTKLDSCSCGPTAGASCLKYFADNGRPKLKHPGGDTTKPAESGRDIGRELQGDMGTNTTKGTTTKGMKAGIKSYLGRHGEPGWTVESKSVKDYSDVGSMFREFGADGEDVIMLLEDPPDAQGRRKSHYVTLGSKASRLYDTIVNDHHVMGLSYRLDFMDPAGGGATTEHEYNVGTDAQGRPTLEGYQGFRDTAPWPRIKEYVKVSPPVSGGAPGVLVPQSPQPLAPGWILVDAVAASGDGLPDTLTWDPTGFEPGLHLIMVIATGTNGRTGSAIRLGGIPEETLEVPGGGAPPRVGIRGSYPSPFRQATAIEFALAAGGTVDLDVYDVAGRRVRRLVAGAPFAPGIHKVVWDGTDARGAAVPSGVYLYRFRAGGVVQEYKVVVVR